MTKILIFGPGWLGRKYAAYLDNAELSTVNIADQQAVAAELDAKKPDVVVNTAGKTGRPNIDWCEDHREETVHSNITGALVLMKACQDRGIHMVHLSSGCIFTGASPKDGGFTEEDQANPVSFYSWTKATADEILKRFPVLILRLRMPIDSEPNPRNLITKLAGYPKIIDVENSVTIIEDLLYTTKVLIEKGKTGIYNAVNPGPVKHRDILAWYKEIVDPSHAYEMIPAEDLMKQGLAKAGRSNCILNTDKLKNDGVVLRPAADVIRDYLKIYAEKLHHS